MTQHRSKSASSAWASWARPWRATCIEAGHELFVYTRGKVRPRSIAKAGATVCASGAEVAKRADIIIIMVPDTPDVEAVLFGEDGVAEGLAPGKIVVDMSSISPIETKEFAAEDQRAGLRLPRRAGVRRRSRRQERHADHHGRRRRGRLRARSSRCSS